VTSVADALVTCNNAVTVLQVTSQLCTQHEAPTQKVCISELAQTLSVWRKINLISLKHEYQHNALKVH
jgi:hypothetical protein